MGQLPPGLRGFTAGDARPLGIGYCLKAMRGLVAIPVRLPTGELADYVGVTEAKLPPHWRGIPTNVVPLPNRA